MHVGILSFPNSKTQQFIKSLKLNSLTIKGLLDTPAAATWPKGVTTGFVCPNAAKPAPC
jgi:hypothetical protein